MIRTEWCWPWPLAAAGTWLARRGKRQDLQPTRTRIQYSARRRQRRCYYTILTLQHAWTTDGADAKVQHQRDKNRWKSETNPLRPPRSTRRSLAVLCAAGPTTGGGGRSVSSHHPSVRSHQDTNQARIIAASNHQPQQDDWGNTRASVNRALANARPFFKPVLVT
jgi:hypothetical protein